ncbi:hypothetical protein G6514_005240 [Epicoccum nigrum]|nr:hypothetical protein G6514_005240 [Epicoccum nigrum]
MPPRKGLATTKKVDKYKYIWVDSDGEEVPPPNSPTPKSKPSKASLNSLEVKRIPPRQSTKDKSPLADSDKGAADPESLRGIPNLSNLHQPCQEPKSSHSDQLQQGHLADRLFPPDERGRPHTQIESVSLDKVSTPSHSDAPQRDSPLELSPRHRRTATSIQSPKRPVRVRSPLSPPARQTPLPSDPFVDEVATANMTSMIPGGAFVPPNQQRNLRACMVCSIVRTQTQFLNGGCPNCEEFLELAGNLDHVSDCTSSVFEGLITVADTSKSWVARYQRLEGYVAGVYATQVEGILPEEWVSTIEAAGINYIPRDGSEDQMIPKD